jgi:D-alanine-D-alanine ligase
MVHERGAANTDPTAYGRVAVLMGGWSAERKISLESGRAVLAALERSGVNATGIDAGRDIFAGLSRERIDRVFIALHGRGGEDGSVQGALETLGIPYTGSGVLASALGMDKRRTKLVWMGAGIPCPPHVLVGSAEELIQVEARIGFPVMVKPSHEGSSIGMGRADDPAGLARAWEAARAFDEEVLVERWVQGPEYTAAVLGRRALPLIRLETSRRFYDYQAKYHDDQTRYLCPCGLDAAKQAELQALALNAFEAVGARGWGRVDFICDEQGRPWCLEINTVPGMTSHSLVPMAAAAAGLSFDALVLRILDSATLAPEADPGSPAARDDRNVGG